MFFALVCIPIIIRGMGIERFGVLNIAWMIVGYFTFFDLGLGRALTRIIAERLSQEDKGELSRLTWSGTMLMLLFGIVGGSVLCILSPWFVSEVFKVPKSFEQETYNTFYIIAFSIPILVSTAGFRGILEAHQRFDLANVVRVAIGVFTFLAPIFILPFSQDLFWITLALVFGRFLVLIAYVIMCMVVMPNLRSKVIIDYRAAVFLLRSGGWMMVSNVISPVMIWLDRFLIGAMLSMAAVAYYSTPWEVVTKLLTVPSAVAAVLFPIFSYSFSGSPQKSVIMFWQGVKYVFLSLFPLVLLCVTFAKEGLAVWLGYEFAENGFLVMQLLAMGVLFNGLAGIPFAYIQGIGKPDITAKIHFVEVILYVPCTYMLIRKFGITGAALSWMVRMGIDSIVLYIFARRNMDSRSAQSLKQVWPIILFLMLLALSMISLPFVVKVLFFALTLLVFVLIGWFVIIEVNEREQIGDMLTSFFK